MLLLGTLKAALLLGYPGKLVQFGAWLIVTFPNSGGLLLKYVGQIGEVSLSPGMGRVF